MSSVLLGKVVVFGGIFPGFDGNYVGFVGATMVFYGFLWFPGF